MQHIKSQQGYTLVLVLGIFVIFTILGFGMMTMTMQGAQKSENRESMTQAQDLAVKGEDHLISKIQNEINQSISNGVSPSFFLHEMNRIIDLHLCDKDITKSTNLITGDFESCVLKNEPLHITNPFFNDTTYNDTNPYNPYQRKLTIQSIGTDSQQGTSKSVESTVILGKNLNLEIYDFAISSRETEEIGSGLLHLGGALTVNGNIYAGNYLQTNNQAKYYTKSLQSLYPTLNNTTIMTNGNIGPVNSNSNFTVAEKSLKIPSIDVKQLINDFNTTFDVKCSNSIVNNCTQIRTIADVGGPLASAVRAAHLNTNIKSEINAVQSIHSEVKLAGKTCLKNAKFNLSLNFLYEELSTPAISSGSCLSNHSMQYDTSKASVIISEEGLYTEKDMFFGFSDVYLDSPTKPHYKFKGNFFIKNNLYIINATFENLINYTNPSKENFANFYVGGDVYIIWGEFINSNINIYADGDIHIINASDTAHVESIQNGTLQIEDMYTRLAPTDNLCAKNINRLCEDDFSRTKSYNVPSVINGTVYSNNRIINHSASSNITFNGGVSGVNVSLTGISGQVFTADNINTLLYTYPKLWETDSFSFMRYITNPDNNAYLIKGNNEPETLSLGVNYCIDKDFKPLSITLPSINPVNNCGELGRHFIADEKYRWPTVNTQQKFSSRIKFNQPNRAKLIENKIIYGLDGYKNSERKID